MKVFLLGGYGRTGKGAAALLVADDLVSEIAIAGRNLDAAERFAAELGVRATAVQVDATDEDQLAARLDGYDILVNAAGPDFVVPLPAVRAAISAGTHYCDIGADGRMTEQTLEFDGEARSAGVTAILGIGIMPGFTNLMAIHAAGQLDQAEEIRVTLVYPLGALGDVNASALTVLNWLNGRVRTYRDGQWVDVEPFEHGVEVVLASNVVVAAYPIGGTEPITLPRYLPDVKTVSSFASLFPPQINELARTQIGSIAVGDFDLPGAAAHFFETVASDPDRWLVPPEGFTSDFSKALSVAAAGRKNGRAARYRMHPVGPERRMFTAHALVAAALKILRGEIHERGVMPPEACFELRSFEEDYMRLLPEPPPAGKVFEGSLDFLD